MPIASYIVIFAGVTIFFIGLPWALYRIIRPKPGPFMVCTTCGHCARSKRVTKGSTMIEVVLWLMLIVPGLVYSLWRVTTRDRVCESCGGHQLVAPESPVGRRMLAGLGLAAAPP